MSVEGVDKNRHVVPRWREYERTLASGELDPVERGQLAKLDDDAFDRKAARWERQQSTALAADLASSAFVLGRSEEERVREAVEYLSERIDEVPDAVTRVVDRLTNGGSVKEASKEESPTERAKGRIRILRDSLRRYPRDVVARVDLALEYAVAGHTEKSERHVDIARKLAGDNRFVARSAARLYVHTGKPARANYIVRSVHNSESDPWLVASELATAAMADQEPAYLRVGRRMSESDRLSAFSTSEISSALGTRRFWKGDWSRSRRRFRQSLERPNDNVLAQAQWMSSKMSGVVVRDEQLARPGTSEAKARKAYEKERYRKAVEECRRWFLDEPYSSLPVQFGSFILSVVLEEYESARRLLREGLRANPNDLTLVNNYVFALLNLGEERKAERILGRVNIEKGSDSQRIALVATKGMLNYRRGREEVGAELYERAIGMADKRGFEYHAAIARYYYAKEEVKRRGKHARQLVSSVVEHSESVDQKQFPFLEQKVTELQRRLMPPSE